MADAEKASDPVVFSSVSIQHCYALLQDDLSCNMLQQ